MRNIRIPQVFTLIRNILPFFACLGKTKNPDFAWKSGFFIFPKHAKNGKILPFEVEQKVEIKGGAKISTELGSFSLIVNILHSKKTGSVSYFCTN